MLNLGKEPVAILGTISAVLVAIQQLALNIPTGVHAVIAVIIVVITTILARTQVTPV